MKAPGGFRFPFGAFCIFWDDINVDISLLKGERNMTERTSAWRSWWVALPLLLFTSLIWAAEFPEISTSELKNKMDSKAVFLFNSESDIEYSLEHIPGAVNIPAGEIAATNKLPQDKETPIVVY